jgi:hypothetical protein
MLAYVNVREMPFRYKLCLILCFVSLSPTRARSQQPANIADQILIEKSAHTMKLLRDGEVLRTYKVALSTVPVGPKQRLR